MTTDLTQMPAALDAVDEQDQIVGVIFGAPPAPDAPEPEVVAYADALLVAMGEAEQEIASLTAAAKLAIKRVADRYEEVARPLHERRARLLAELERAAPALWRGAKSKSRNLPAGTLGWRTKPAHLFVDDAKAALVWAGKAGEPEEFINSRVVESVDHAALQAHALATGEVPDGCRLEPETETFYAKPNPQPRLTA